MNGKMEYVTVQPFAMMGNVAWKTKKKSTHTQDLSMEMHSYEREEYVYVPS
jgi:hypothetical protein